MRGIVWLLLLFAIAVVAALTLGDNDGLASLYWGGWRVDMSMNLFLFGAVFLAFIGFGAWQGVQALLTLPQQARQWRLLKRERAAQAALREALAERLAGRWTRAHRAALRALALHDGSEGLPPDPAFDLLALIVAAGSLHHLQDRAGRDELQQRLLQLARRGSAGAADDAARLISAEWALDDADAARAESLLAELPPGVARRTQSLRLKLRAARLARRPREALQIARLLAKHGAFTPAAAQALLRSLAIEVIDGVHDVEQLRRAWQTLEGADRADPFVAARAARRAALLDAHADARLWLRPHWQRLDAASAEARHELALALAEATPGIDADWLPLVEQAQRGHAAQPAVQLAAGAAFAARGLWGKARLPLEGAARADNLAAASRRQAWQALALIARHEGDDERAQSCDAEAARL
ncbi:MAG: heme biosynthesis HemY N-terminal domain-containing protein [Aquabacterium sp.]